MISGTIVYQSGRTLSGQTTEAFWTSVSHARPLLSIGLNCALGSDQMRPYISELSRMPTCFPGLYPNAALPDELGGTTKSRESRRCVVRNKRKGGVGSWEEGA